MTCGEVVWDLLKLVVTIGVGGGFLYWREVFNRNREDRNNEKERRSERRKLLTDKMDCFIDEINKCRSYVSSHEVMTMTTQDEEHVSTEGQNIRSYEEVILKLEDHYLGLDKYTVLYFSELNKEVDEVKRLGCVIGMLIKRKYERNTLHEDKENAAQLINHRYMMIESIDALIKTIYSKYDILTEGDYDYS